MQQNSAETANATFTWVHTKTMARKDPDKMKISHGARHVCRVRKQVPAACPTHNHPFPASLIMTICMHIFNVSNLLLTAVSCQKEPWMMSCLPAYLLSQILRAKRLPRKYNYLPSLEISISSHGPRSIKCNPYARSFSCFWHAAVSTAGFSTVWSRRPCNTAAWCFRSTST
jgi:hypothetical protein